MDGDEVLTLDAIRNFPAAIDSLTTGAADVLSIPFIYLWDSQSRRRNDGIYGDQPDGYPILRFPRLFTTLRVSEDDLFEMHFAWQGTRGGFHCGSVPREHFQQRIDGQPIQGGFAPLSVAHYGYLDAELRETKVAFYRKIDPPGTASNSFEGNYAHCLGEPDQHAPGPVTFVPWQDV
jgi:hypothetical protein